MAATRLIAFHVNKGKSVAQCLADRTDVSQNAEKTNNGEFISSYECDPKTADEEFLLCKRQYQHIAGKQQKNNVIVYQIRQSFKPGEITPEEANQVGYETAKVGRRENTLLSLQRILTGRTFIIILFTTRRPWTAHASSRIFSYLVWQYRSSVTEYVRSMDCLSSRRNHIGNERKELYFRKSRVNEICSVRRLTRYFLQNLRVLTSFFSN